MNAKDDLDFQSGLRLMIERDYDSAILSLRAAEKSFPDDVDVLRELGIAYARRGESTLPAVLRDNTSAVSSYLPVEESVKESISGAFQAAVGLAVVQASKIVGRTDWIVRYRDDFRQAIDLLTRAGSMLDAQNKPDAEVYYSLALCLRYLGFNEQAKDAAKRAVEIAPHVAEYAHRARVIDTINERGDIADRARPAWADVVLPQKTKRELKQMQLMLEDPNLAHSLGVEPPTGLLLYGPPGTGKTTIARVLASEAKCKFFATSPAEINTMWLGESEKQVKRLFDQARQSAPSIIFIDEIDALLPSRSGGVNMYSDKVVNQFLHEMDGLKANRGVFVIGATNRRDMLDPALLRGGRLSREIEIPVPDAEGLIALYTLYLKGKNVAPDVTPEALAQKSAGFTGATIRALVNEAGMQALIRISEADETNETADIIKQLTMADFEEAFENFAVAPQNPQPNPYDNIRRIFG
jgi:transitional endoplasmic reticulum ATPase